MHDSTQRLLILLVVLTLSSTATAWAQTGQWIYKVDFVCGYQPSDAPGHGYEPVVKVANYATKIDLFNPDLAAQANLSGEVLDVTGKSWPMTVASLNLAGMTLPGGTATMLDCPTLLQPSLGSPLPPGKPFRNGVAVIRSDVPLVVWATKTTQICAGLATVDGGELPDPIVIVDHHGQPQPGSSGSVSPPPRPTLLGCPVAVRSENPGGGQQGPFLQPGGAVPPGLRSVGMISGSPAADDLQLASLGIGHSIDFERVEPEVIEPPMP